MPGPADLYLRLHGDGAVVATTGPARRVGALALAILILAAVPVMWVSAEVVGISAPKAAIASSGDDDNSGPGSGDDDDDDSRDGKTDHTDTRSHTATRSRDATNTDSTGVSTKAQTATRSRDDTRTKNTGHSTRGSR
jgi:hypothetical protein